MSQEAAEEVVIHRNEEEEEETMMEDKEEGKDEEEEEDVCEDEPPPTAAVEEERLILEENNTATKEEEEEEEEDIMVSKKNEHEQQQTLAAANAANAAQNGFMQNLLTGEGRYLPISKWMETGLLVVVVYAFIFWIFWKRRNRLLLQNNHQQRTIGAADNGSSSSNKDANNTSSSKEQAAMAAASSSNPAATGFTFPMEDLVYVADLLAPDSTHMDIYYALISSPQVLADSSAALAKVEEIKAAKKRQEAEEEKKKKSTTDSSATDFSSLVDDEGWGDDAEQDKEDDDEATKRAKEEERQKRAHMERLKAATGRQALPLLEGMDDGVLGQKWVEETLAASGQWPPPQGLGILEGKTFAYQDPVTGKVSQLSALQHPALRRNLCMTCGRLNSTMLNTHPDLIAAGQEKRIDPTYFKAAMEFRMRLVVLLESSLRVALTLRSYKLFATMVECIALFKIGCLPTTGLPWFNGLMARTYNTLPRMSVGTVVFTKHVVKSKQQQQQNKQKPNNNTNNNNNNKPPAEIIPIDTIVAGQTAAVVLPVERTHAEKFTKTKLAQWKKQGVPPQVAMASYREGWWFLLRCERLDDTNNNNSSSSSSVKSLLNTEDGAKVLGKVHPDTVKRFNETVAPEYYLQTAWPMIVQNIGQKSGTVKISITAPSEPGRYRYHVGIQSQDFLGADQEVAVDITVVPASASKGTTPTIAEGDEDEDDDDDDDDDSDDAKIQPVD